MKKPEAVLQIFDKYVPIIDSEIGGLLENQENHQMYRTMEYFLGYRDEKLNKIEEYAGKRFRSGTCLLLADYYNVLSQALPVATSIEIFHNFTLIHDDIEDNDELRRGRPTVWKLWGLNQAINTGDAQLALCYIELLKYLKTNPKKGLKVQELLYENYLKVAEGQHMDIKLAESSLNNPYVTSDNYMDMIYKKSATLVGVSTKAAGLVAELKDAENQTLWDYGVNLGLAYQLSDDLISIWGKAENTGKNEAKDLSEKKKTLPVIYLHNKLGDSDKKDLEDIYSQPGELENKEVNRIKELLTKNGAHDYVWEKMIEKIELSNRAIEKLSLSNQQKETLLSINRTLIPSKKWWEE